MHTSCHQTFLAYLEIEVLLASKLVALLAHLQYNWLGGVPLATEPTVSLASEPMDAVENYSATYLLVGPDVGVGWTPSKAIQFAAIQASLLVLAVFSSLISCLNYFSGWRLSHLGFELQQFLFQSSPHLAF